MSNRSTLAFLSAVATLASCGGGGGGDVGGTFVSAGANRSVASADIVEIQPSAGGGSGVASFSWTQTAGPSVGPLTPTASGRITFIAPSRSSAIELEVAGRGQAGGVIDRDRVVITVAATRPELSTSVLANIDVRGGGDGRAIASAIHEGSNRLFVIDGVTGDVLAYDISSPSSPTFAGSLPRAMDTPGFTAGAPVAIAAAPNGFLGITWTGETTEFPGVLQIVDPGTLQALAQVSTTGANPVDVEVSADGNFFAVACAGDPPTQGAGDGRGYVTLVTIPPGGPSEIQVHRDLDPIVLSSGDGNEAALEALGIRFFRNNLDASVELTPRSVAISPDGATVWASCPENDALIVIDVASKLITDLLPIADRSFAAAGPTFESNGFRLRYSEGPNLFTTPLGDDVPFGGITGIFRAGDFTSAGDFSLIAISGSGPEIGPLDRDGNGAMEMTLIDPDAGHALRTLSNSPDSQDVFQLDAELELRTAGGEAITGRPGQYASQPFLRDFDEPMLDLAGAAVATDPLGARFGGATSSGGGNIWLAESRRNGIWRFQPGGTLIERYVPAGTPAAFGSPTLPEAFANRRLQVDAAPGERFGGFGAIAYDPQRGTILAAVRLPLDVPDSLTDAASFASQVARVIELDEATGAVTGEYVIVLDRKGHAIEGMTFAAAVTPSYAGMFLLEAATDPAGFRGIYEFDVQGATNLRTLSASAYGAINDILETTSPDELDQLPTPVVPIKKTLRADLRELGLGGGRRPSALAELPNGFVIGYDDDFQLDGATVEAGGISPGRSGPAPIGFVSFERNGIDASPGTGSLDFASLPISGLSQPLDMIALSVRGEDRLLTANGGLARVLETPSGNLNDERQRVGGLLLDTGVFTDPAQLQSPDVAGDLLVSSVGDDSDGNMLVDTLLAFGSRSISLRGRRGEEVWRSPRSLEERAFEARPTRVSDASTLYGIRPNRLAIGELTGEAILGVGLEEAGLVMLYDLSNSGAPVLAGIGSRANRPADIDFASIGGTLLVVTDRERGRVELRRVSRQ